VMQVTRHVTYMQDHPGFL